MFDRHQGGERVLLVQLNFGQEDIADHLLEARLLILSTGALFCGSITGKRQAPDAATFAGKGKVEEIAAFVKAEEIDLVVFNHALSPAQERNLEHIVECRVIDRTSLILDIFAKRAQSADGKLQVELAQLSHLSTRLVRGWTHLERQKGGIGLRGPGETQLETDRRLLGNRVKLLKDRLARVSRQRDTQGQSRRQSAVLNVSIVGYTNAGKSTLFNALTHAKTYAADQLFATLDTTSRKLWLGEEAQAVISDTVGFIRDLPHELVAAFHATLEATKEADVLLHVVDFSSDVKEMHITEVNKVLKSVGSENVAQIVVLNKLDMTSLPPLIEKNDYGRICRIRVSAKSGTGMSDLREHLKELALEKKSLLPSAGFAVKNDS